MSDTEIKAWMSMLTPGKQRQREIICDLLAHAIVDAMSVEDQAVCKRALEMSNAQGV